jgi:hypothetical protein
MAGFGMIIFHRDLRLKAHFTASRWLWMMRLGCPYIFLTVIARRRRFVIPSGRRT